MTSQKFPRGSRMTERSQFLRLFEGPSVYRAATFQAFWKANPTGACRLGITIKGRLGSIWRMRMKRVVREWFRKRKEKIGSCDLNVVIRVPARLDMDYMDLLRKQLHEWKA